MLARLGVAVRTNRSCQCRCQAGKRALQLAPATQARQGSGTMGGCAWAASRVKADGTAPAFASAVLDAAAATPKLLTLVMIDDGKRVLLGLKKRGFGAGYYNGFGGKVEPGETVRQAAERELLEEACIEAEDLREAGVLVFTFEDQPVPWEVHVFAASSFRGEPTETDEMAPVWFAHEDVPYDRMWADDVFWYPALLRKSYFRGVFAFQQTTQLVWHLLQEGEEADAREVAG